MAASRREWQRPSVFGRRELKWAVYAGVLGFLLWSAWGLRISPTRFLEGLGYGRALLGQMLPPSAGSEGVARIVDKLGESIAMAMVATVTGIVLSVPVAFMAAENISPRPLYYANRGLISLSRALHGLIVAIIAVKAVGIGPLAGIVAITFKTVGFFSKLLAEDIEDIDMGGVEAARAAGASPVQTLLYGVVPQVVPRFVGLTVYRWDINIRQSTVIGIVGAGGIGTLLLRAFERYDYAYVAAILSAIVAVVLVAEGVSALVRRRYK